MVDLSVKAQVALLAAVTAAIVCAVAIGIYALVTARRRPGTACLVWLSVSCVAAGVLFVPATAAFSAVFGGAEIVGGVVSLWGAEVFPDVLGITEALFSSPLLTAMITAATLVFAADIVFLAPKWKGFGEYALAVPPADGDGYLILPREESSPAPEPKKSAPAPEPTVPETEPNTPAEFVFNESVPAPAPEYIPVREYPHARRRPTEGESAENILVVRAGKKSTPNRRPVITNYASEAFNDYLAERAEDRGELEGAIEKIDPDCGHRRV